jgi:hypothetical protein
MTNHWQLTEDFERSFAERQLGARCPDCGHGEWFHRANTVDQLRSLDDPIPCFAVVGLENVPGFPPTPSTPVYRYCGCTTVLPLTFTP